MADKVLEFIQKRFRKDCDWINGNCYYFAVILKDRFPEGTIYYDVIHGHFVFEYEINNEKCLYDWVGIYDCTDGYLVEWDKFDESDVLQKDRIIRDCIM